MTYERRITTKREDDAHVPADRTVVRDEAVRDEVVRSDVVETAAMSPSGGEMIRRLVVLIFGIIQSLIVLRIVLLLLNAREGNELVAFILNASQLFVAPFIGIFNEDALQSGGSVLDIAAIAALVGWTILEWIILWAVNVFRREPV